jgi:hypothetical protein
VMLLEGKKVLTCREIFLQTICCLEGLLASNFILPSNFSMEVTLECLTNKSRNKLLIRKLLQKRKLPISKSEFRVVNSVMKKILPKKVKNYWSLLAVRAVVSQLLWPSSCRNTFELITIF